MPPARGFPLPRKASSPWSWMAAGIAPSIMSPRRLRSPLLHAIPRGFPRKAGTARVLRMSEAMDGGAPPAVGVRRGPPGPLAGDVRTPKILYAWQRPIGGPSLPALDLSQVRPPMMVGGTPLFIILPTVLISGFLSKVRVPLQQLLVSAMSGQGTRCVRCSQHSNRRTMGSLAPGDQPPMTSLGGNPAAPGTFLGAFSFRKKANPTRAACRRHRPGRLPAELAGAMPAGGHGAGGAGGVSASGTAAADRAVPCRTSASRAACRS